MIFILFCILAGIEYLTTFYLMWRGRTDARLRELNPIIRFCMRIGFWPFQIGRLVVEVAVIWFVAVKSNRIPFAIMTPFLAFIVANNLKVIRGVK